MVREGFCAEKEAADLIQWIRDWFAENGPSADAVIGLSGGKDSTVCAYLLAEALGKDRVVGVMMPDGVQADIQDSRKVAQELGIRSYEVDVHDAVEAVKKEITDLFHGEISADTRINIPPRIRMTTLYAIAQSLPKGGRVVNTCNASEDYIGYSTKYGDAAGDVGVLSDYVVSEVLQIGDAIGVPKDLLYKAPSDGLCGKTDEDNLGFTYSALDEYIITGKGVDEKMKENIDRRHRLNLHKLKTLPYHQRSNA